PARVRDQRERLADPLDEGLDADEADVRVGLRLADQMLAAAEADLEAGFALVRKERGGIDRALGRQGDPRQQLLEQRLPARRQRPPGAAAVEPTRAVRAVGRHRESL